MFDLCQYETGGQMEDNEAQLKGKEIVNRLVVAEYRQ